MKPLIRTVHLWAGLIFGTILVLQGLTGTVIGWRHELDAWLNPGLLRVAPPAGAPAGLEARPAPAQVAAVMARLQDEPGYGRPDTLFLPEVHGDVYVAWYRPQKPDSSWTQGVTRQVMVDPANLAILGERDWGEAGLSRPLLMPTLFHLHRYLMAGDAGKIVIAVQGLALMLLCLSGIVVWWPKMTLSAFWHAISVRRGSNWPKFNFQLHRAAGFYVAPVLLVLAFSGVYFNAPDWVTPAIRAVAPLTKNEKALNTSAKEVPRIDAGAAMAAAQVRYPEGRVSRIGIPAKPDQPYEVRVRQPGELRHGAGATRVSVDAGSGEIVRAIDPLTARGGDWFVSTLFPLHTGEAFGLAGRILISVVGLTPMLFFITGLVVWIKFRRKPAKRKAPAKVAAPRPAPVLVQTEASPVLNDPRYG
ncbi:PepSY domain-containing protein [Massilia sp. LC238]|uniref:PepSY-associated TM helix domain-containing protein n=1 Tax=Massilia sp. LC238 TaxID=1502852 RepID=UPI0004E31B8C|nr:PepSY-associated TM helix domain-containing protein [Massilia sp. LC238]KFC71420.1 putative iron-regulated membrane protein Iron-uptake factor PiuB [Massilia sp. LC238]